MHDIEFSEEQHMIRDMTRDFAKAELASNAKNGRTGLFRYGSPEEWGGSYIDYTSYALVVEEISAGWVAPQLADYPL